MSLDMKNFILIVCCTFALSLKIEAQDFAERRIIQRLDTKGFAQGPTISPDGNWIAFSRESYNGVFVLNLETNAVQTVCSHLGSGWGMIWLDNQRIVARSIVEGGTYRDRMMGLELIDVESKTESLLIPFASQNRIDIPHRTPSGVVWVRNNKDISTLEAPSSIRASVQIRPNKEVLWFFQGDKLMAGTMSIAAPDCRTILSIVWSPDGSKGLVELLGRPSLYLFEMSTRSFKLISEAGERPAWLNNDSCVYMETKDDGHTIVGGEIYTASISQNKRNNLTALFDGIALNPTPSRDGNIVFNSIDGQLFLIHIQPR